MLFFFAWDFRGLSQTAAKHTTCKSGRCSPTVNSFKHEAKKYYTDKALDRSLSM